MSNRITAELAASTITLAASAAGIASNAIGAISTDPFNRSISGFVWLRAYARLVVTFAAAPTEGTALYLYARRRDVGGTGTHEDVPEANRPGPWLMGFFTVNNVTTAQHLTADIVLPAPGDCEVYLLNAGTGQSVPAGTVLHITPYALALET